MLLQMVSCSVLKNNSTIVAQGEYKNGEMVLLSSFAREVELMSNLQQEETETRILLPDTSLFPFIFTQKQFEARGIFSSQATQCFTIYCRSKL